MQNSSDSHGNPNDSPIATTTPAHADGATGAAVNTGATADARQSPPVSQPEPPKRRVNPLWFVAAAIAVFALVFGVAGLANGGARATSSPSGSDLEQTTINVIQAVDPSVVQIQAQNSRGGGSVGSGEILTTSGYIVTNSHVVHGFSTFRVLLSSGHEVAATLVGEAPSEDLAVLKINAEGLKPITVSDSSKVQVGQYAIAMGSPLGLEQSATSGIVSALNRSGKEVVDGNVYTLRGMIQTSAPINPGNSGGALVNLRGELVGIPTLSAVDPSTGVAANGIGYAIASSHMEAIVHQIIGS